MSTKDLKEFFSKFSASLQVLARDRRHVELESKLEALHVLLEAWLDVAPPKADRPERSRLFMLFDRFSGPLDVDMRDLAEQAVLSGDTTTQQVITDAVARFAFRCFHRDQPALAQEYLDSLVFLYYRCRDSDSSLDAVGTRLDTILHSLLSHATYPQDKLRAEPTETVVSAFRFALLLLKAATRLRRPRDAGYFVERLFKVREHCEKHHSFGPSEKLSLTSDIMLDYVFVLAIGWALEVIQNSDSGYHSAAQKIIQEARPALPSREMLIAEWELVHDGDVRGSRIGARLGVSNWDVTDLDREIRPGIATVRLGGGDWSKQGLRAALLLTTKRSRQDIDELCGGPANRYAWDVNAERDALQKLAEEDSLSIPESDREKRIDLCLALITKRARGGNANYLRYVLDTPLSNERKQTFEQQAIDSWAKHRSWIDALGDRASPLPESVVMPHSTERAIWVPREYLLDDNNWASGFGDHLGEVVGRQECANLFGKLEEVAAAGESVQFLAKLPELVRRAIRAMVDAGFSPDWLMLPQEDRFAGALFRKPLWQIEGRNQYGSASIGDWEGLHVLRCPYTNPQAILLIDTARALAGTTSPYPTRTGVTIDDKPENDDAKAKRDAANSALADDAAELPKSSDIVVLARMTVEPTLGIADAAAVLKLSIENSDGGFAITEDSDLYHRPSCPDIAFHDVEYVLRPPKTSDRKPCPTCKPEKWNREGRRGQIDGGPEANEKQ